MLLDGFANTHKTVSLTELRDPAKAGSSPVAVLNRNKVVGYFVPTDVVERLSFESATDTEVLEALKKSHREMKPVLNYLRDK